MTTVDIRNIVDETELSHRAKYAELVMKCLWKVSKTVKESLEDGSLDTRVLLKDIDDFLVAIPPAEWRRRANDNVPLADMPLRTVKTILQQVVSTYGESVYDMLSLIDNPDQAFVYQYLFRLLNNSRTAASEAPSRGSTLRRLPSSPAPPVAAAKPATPAQTNGHGHEQHVSSPSAPRPNGDSVSEVDLNNHLTEVFAMIGNPTESKKVRFAFAPGNRADVWYRASRSCTSCSKSIQRPRAKSTSGSEPPARTFRRICDELSTTSRPKTKSTPSRSVQSRLQRESVSTVSSC